MTLTELTPVTVPTEVFAIPCDSRNAMPEAQSCWSSNPAEWVLFMVRCCDEGSSEFLFCTRCRDYLLSWSECHCRACHASWKPATEAVLRIEPIGGTR